MVERLGEMRKGRRERVEKGSSERTEKRKRRELLDSAVKRCNSEVLVSSGVAW